VLGQERGQRAGSGDEIGSREELAYLANVLVAGDTSRAWQPVEAAERVLELCDAGLRAVLEQEGDAAPEAAREALVRWGAAGLFRTAWAARPPR
jgi:hypothetical protein